ncbi:hypothetical protein [Candidatus Phytoplasma australiense]|nr:hypothetical protein [Candidatus Phytoplasma australiense]
MDFYNDVVNNRAIWTFVSVLIILSALLLSDSDDFISMGGGSFGSSQTRKIKGERFFLNFVITLLTVSCLGLSLYMQLKPIK